MHGEHQFSSGSRKSTKYQAEKGPACYRALTGRATNSRENQALIVVCPSGLRTPSEREIRGRSVIHFGVPCSRWYSGVGMRIVEKTWPQRSTAVAMAPLAWEISLPTNPVPSHLLVLQLEVIMDLRTNKLTYRIQISNGRRNCLPRAKYHVAGVGYLSKV